MLNKIKKVFNLKFLTFGLFLILSVAISAMVSFSNITITQPSSTLNVKVESKEIIEQDFLTLNVVNFKGIKVSRTSATPEEGKGGWQDVDGSDNNIDGGSDIKIQYDGTNKYWYIEYGNSSKKYFAPSNGYELADFIICTGDAGNHTTVFTISFSGISIASVKNASGTEVKSTYVKSEVFTCKPEDIISDYSACQSIYVGGRCSLITYSLDLFYHQENNAASNAVSTYSKKVVNYNITQTVDLSANGNTDDGIVDWGYWILRKDVLTPVPGKTDEFTYGTYNIKLSDSADKDSNYDLITISSPSVNVSLTCGKEIDKGYKLTTLNVGSYGNITQSGTNPLIAAKISREYDLTIDNSNADWATSTLTKIDNENNLLAGAVSSGVKDGESEYVAKLTIKDNSDYAYKFTSNAGYAFYKGNEIYRLTDTKGTVKPTIDNNYYYVYNYGYEITGWKIYFYYDDGNSTTGNYYGLQYVDGSWSLTSHQLNPAYHILLISLYP